MVGHSPTVASMGSFEAAGDMLVRMKAALKLGCSPGVAGSEEEHSCHRKVLLG